MSAMSRSLYSRLCFLPLFTRPAAPRLANQAINLPVEANRPHVVTIVLYPNIVFLRDARDTSTNDIKAATRG